MRISSSIFRFFVFLLSGGFFLISCGGDEFPAPIAGFDVSIQSATVKDKILFTNTSVNAEEYEWDFGDGNKSFGINVEHQFKIGGTYTVVLTAKGAGGTDSFSQEVEVKSITPTAGFDFPSDVFTAPAIVQFTNTSECMDSYSWDFGDGGTSKEEHPSHMYEVPGVYTVVLEASGEYGSASVNKNITVSGSIVEGISVGEIKIGDNFQTVKNAYGLDYQVFTTCGNVCVHLIIYEELGLTFGFVNSSLILANQDPVLGIFAEAPYTGYTSKGIHIESLKPDVENEYGQPEDIDTSFGLQYEYPSIGIDFSFEGVPYAVSRIFVYEKDGFTGDIAKDELVSVFENNK